MHLADCHSWHKHLPLINGGQFIITSDVNAGRNYPTKHPNLPFGINCEGYQEAFGKLMFFWKSFGEPIFQSDGLCNGLSETELNDKYNLTSNIILFPYLSSDFIEAIHYHKTNLEAISNEMEHEEKQKLTYIYNLHCIKENYLQTKLTDEERELVVLDSKLNLSKNMRKYFDVETELLILLEELRQKEIEKIRKAIDKLRIYSK